MKIEIIKKLAAGLAACVMLTSLTACGDGEGSSSDASSSGTADATDEAEVVTKLGFIYNGSVDEFGFAEICNDQRIKAQQYSQIESEYIDNVNVAGFEKAVKLLVEDGCTHIVAGSPVYSNIVDSVAKNYMNISFINYGSTLRTSNVYGYSEAIYQGAYVAGMAAAYNSESEKVGIVVDPSMLYPVQTVNAAALGTQLVYTTSQLVVASAREDSEIHSAVDALAAKGCDVIISYTASPETVEYCGKKGIKVVGSLDYSNSENVCDEMLMYFYSSRDSFYLSQYKSMQMKEWQPNTYMGTLSNGVICISDALPAAKDGTQDIMNKLIPKVASGSAYIFEGQLKDINGSIKQRDGVAMSQADIESMSWYVSGVDSSLDSFIESKMNNSDGNSDMTIRN